MAAVSQSDEETEDWEFKLVLGSVDAWVALVLPALSRIQSIHITPNEQCTGIITRMMTRVIQGTKPFNEINSLQSLEAIYTWWDDHCDGPYADELVPLFGFPHLRKFTGYMLQEEILEVDFPKRSSTVTELALLNCTCQYGMRSLIESCKSLKSFKYTQGMRTIGFQAIFAPASFGDSLSLTRETLEEL